MFKNQKMASAESNVRVSILQTNASLYLIAKNETATVDFEALRTHCRNRLTNREMYKIYQILITLHLNQINDLK